MSRLPEQGENCLNCGARLQGPYCSACGQKALEQQHESFWKTMVHFLGDFIHFDSQIFRTAIPLLFKPGYLANEYLAGKRVRYFNPIRMYVFLSFLFFFLYFTFDRPDVQSAEPVMQRKTADSLVRQELDSVRQYAPIRITIDSSVYTSLAAYDSVQQTKPKAARDGFIKRSFIRKGLSLKERYGREGRESLVNALLDNFMHHIPKLAFILLPLFALLLKGFFRRKRMLYVEHLIVTVYLYDFIFLFGSLILILSLLIRPWAEFFASLQFYGILLYVLVMLRRVYENSWGRSLVKLFLIGISFCILLGTAFVVNLLAAFWSV